ncbi:MAG: HAD-IA family hydrolase [Chlorobiaceae bacterium]|nr:HAD-IA family hydrolase [Chlorobiaceae bacterium]
MSIILLDIGNVVASVDFLRFCTAVVSEGNSDPHALSKKYCEGELKVRFDQGIIAPLDYLCMIGRDSMTGSMSHGEIRERWQNVFTPLTGAEEAVEALSREHRIWIMSDTDPLHFAHLKHHYPLLSNRERYYLSYEHGFLKSSPEAFQHVLEDSGLGAHEFVLIDDKHENCRSAATVGIKSILFDSWSDTIIALAAL